MWILADANPNNCEETILNHFSFLLNNVSDTASGILAHTVGTAELVCAAELVHRSFAANFQALLKTNFYIL
jgi:hypothetical protein